MSIYVNNLKFIPQRYKFYTPRAIFYLTKPQYQTQGTSFWIVGPGNTRDYPKNNRLLLLPFVVLTELEGKILLLKKLHTLDKILQGIKLVCCSINKNIVHKKFMSRKDFRKRGQEHCRKTYGNHYPGSWDLTESDPTTREPA